MNQFLASFRTPSLLALCRLSTLDTDFESSYLAVLCFRSWIAGLA